MPRARRLLNRTGQGQQLEALQRVAAGQGGADAAIGKLADRAQRRRRMAGVGGDNRRGAELELGGRKMAVSSRAGATLAAQDALRLQVTHHAR